MVQHHPLPKSGFPACLETASAKAGQRSRHAAAPPLARGSGIALWFLGKAAEGKVAKRVDEMMREGAAGKPAQAGGGWKATLAAVLKEHNGARQDGAVASFATRDKRGDMLYAGFKRLRQLHFRLDTVTSLRGKQIEALVKDWHARSLSASTLQNNLSIFRTFAEWIGKAGMVRGIDHYLGSGTAARSSIAREDKTWSAHSIDVSAKIEQIRQKDARRAPAPVSDCFRSASPEGHAAPTSHRRQGNISLRHAWD